MRPAARAMAASVRNGTWRRLVAGLWSLIERAPALIARSHEDQGSWGPTRDSSNTFPRQLPVRASYTGCPENMASRAYDHIRRMCASPRGFDRCYDHVLALQYSNIIYIMHMLIIRRIAPDRKR
jgi:hypothetical protein